MYYFLCGSVLIRAIGTTAHPGAIITVPHRCPALIRAIGTTAHPGAVSTVPHGCPAAIRAISTPRAFFRSAHHYPARRIGTREAVDTPAERQHYAALLAGVKIGTTVSTEKLPANCDAPPHGL
jgi:hypothetical protein